ncbi:MAG: cytochrome c biogenesis protein CcsA [Planctomycetota bacterium]
MIQFLAVALPVVYLAVLLAYVHDFLAKSENRHTRLRRTYFWLALALHAAYFAALSLSGEGVPAFHRLHFVSAVALTTGALYGVVGEGRESTRQGRAGVGLFVVGLVFLMQFVASAFAPLTVASHEQDPTFYFLHVGTLLLASASLALSGTYGGLYLLLYRQMRTKEFGPLYRSLPSLSELAALTRRASAFACVLLFAGINGGIWWAHARHVEGFSYDQPLVLIALFLSLHLAIVALSKRVPAMNPRRASIAATVGFGAFVVSLVWALVPGGFH